MTWSGRLRLYAVVCWGYAGYITYINTHDVSGLLSIISAVLFGAAIAIDELNQ